MYLEIFFSDIYYQTIDYKNHLLIPTLTIIINGGFIFEGFIALITLVFRTYKAIFYISELLIALFYLVLGNVIIYFGHKISEILKAKSQQSNGYSNERNNNLGFMSYSIGGLFLLKGVRVVFEGIGEYDPPNHNVYDFFVFDFRSLNLLLLICF